jgi:hypothetical protein
MTDTISTWEPKWWSDPWWEGVDYQQESGLSLGQIRAAIDALAQVFDEAWTRRALQAGPPNAVIPILFGGRGLWPFAKLMWLARIARAVSSSPSLHRPLRELIGERTKATLFELEVASWFGEQSWAIEFLKPSRKQRSPDIQVQKGELRSAIECKRFESEQWEEWASTLSWALIHRLRAYTGPETPRFDILFEPRLSDLVWGDDAVVRTGILEEVAQCIEDAVRHALQAMPPTSVSVPGLAHICFASGTEKGGLHGIGGIEVSPQAKMRRMVKNGILEAAEQLSTHAPGVVAVSSEFAPPKPLMDAVLGGIHRANATLLQSVGVVVIPGVAGASSVIWENPSWVDHPVCREVIATLAGAMMSPAGASTPHA